MRNNQLVFIKKFIYHRMHEIKFSQLKRLSYIKILKLLFQLGDQREIMLFLMFFI